MDDKLQAVPKDRFGVEAQIAVAELPGSYFSDLTMLPDGCFAVPPKEPPYLHPPLPASLLPEQASRRSLSRKPWG